MKIFDCITYFNEPLLFELRLNILDKYVDEFIVAEALYTHSGKQKKINFDKELYPNFKNRIKHLIVENEPKNIISTNQIDENDAFDQKITRNNAVKRIELQRNAISKIFKKINNNDWIIYSDSDEIPNLENINFNDIKEKFLTFKQGMYYYKFNLTLPTLDWYGSKACRFKDLNTISELRYIKSKKYNWWRLDTFFKKNKFINLKIIENGGWHFTNIKTPNEIYVKHSNDEHHDEFDRTGIVKENIEDMINNRYIPYDHSIDKKKWEKKWNKNNRIKLSVVNNFKLPKYLFENITKYTNWFDFNE
jgi:beta-1,4-mannosyl-glycoprotein beta-1,4-N-acetylglucosaminyltransferase